LVQAKDVARFLGVAAAPALVSGVSPSRSGSPSDETLPRTLAHGRRKVCQNRWSNGVPTPKFRGTGQLSRACPVTRMLAN